MNEELWKKLTGKDHKFACALTEIILSESRETDQWYESLDTFASLLEDPNSLVRNRGLYLLAANVQWDTENRFDRILPRYLAHITDEKPITARQCIQALAEIGLAQPRYIPEILSSLENADLSGYRDSMRPLLEKDIARTMQILTNNLEINGGNQHGSNLEASL